MDFSFKMALTLSIWLVSLGLAYRYATREQFKTAIFFLVVGGLALRLYCAADPWLHLWDERYHFLVAKNMLENPFKPLLYKWALLDYDYRAWSQNHIWLHKPPLTLWLITASFKVFGVSELAGRLPSVILSTLSVILVYDIAWRLLKNRWLALATVFFQSHNGLVIELAAGRNPTDHVDTVFFFFVLAGIWFATRFVQQKKLWILVFTGLCLGLAILSKWLIGLIIVPLLFILCIDKYGLKTAFLSALAVLVTGLVIALPWQWYIYGYFPLEAAWESRFNLMHFTENLEGHARPWWFFLDKARTNWNELIFPAWIYFAVLWYKNRSRPEYQLIAVWILLPYLVFSASLTKMQGYVLFTAPAHFMILAIFMGFLFSRFKTWYGLGFKLIFAAVLLLSLRYAYERARFSRPPEPASAVAREIKALSAGLDEKTVVFNTPYFIEFMFYSNATAYERRPSMEEKSRLKKEGYHLKMATEENGGLVLKQIME